MTASLAGCGTTQVAGRISTATGDAAEFVLHTAHGCDSNQVGPSKSESYTRLWFTLLGQDQRITVVSQVIGPGDLQDPIGLPRCFTSMTRFYAALPAAPSGSPSPQEPSPSPDPTGILDDPQPPGGANDYLPGNRWHGTVAGRDTNVYAGAALGESGGPHDGMVIVELDQPGTADSQTLYLHAPGSGPLMLVAAQGDRLVLRDSMGYRHTLILAGPKTLEYKERGPRVAIPAESLGPAAPCENVLRHLVTVAAGPDTPYPRCAAVFSDQALRVQNHTGFYGQSPHPITVRFPTLPTTTLQPGQSVVFPHPFARLAPGVHTLYLGR